MRFENSLRFAKSLDQADPLRQFRKKFHIPEFNGKPSLYFTGNSLGLEPVTAQKLVLEELEDWAKLGVEGHFHARRPWLTYHKQGRQSLARIVGAKVSEVVAMNQLTINLHLMLTSFYVPAGKRFKILTEAGAFSSDQYAFESHLRNHGYSSDQALIELQPRPGEFTLRESDVLKAIRENADSLSLVIFGGVQYYSGQFFNIKAITAAAHRAGARAGFDLAHAVGNVPLSLHDDGVDFAVWCSYKYLNSGPGAIAGAFVHEQHATSNNLPRLAGWWGHIESERFEMKKGFLPSPGVEGWQVSNFPILSGAPLLASLEIFRDAGMSKLRKKSIMLTSFMEFLLREMLSAKFTIITPAKSKERGCQLSILMKHDGRKVFRRLKERGVVADWREPDVIRVAPVPLYNTYEDVFRFARIFALALQ